MISTTTAFSNLLAGSSRHFLARVLQGGNVLNCDIKNIKIYKGACGDDTMTVGSVYSSYAELTVSGLTTLLENKDIEIQIGMTVSGQPEYITMGKFTVNKVKSSADESNITAIGFISSKLTVDLPTLQSQTIPTIISGITSATGITITLSGLTNAGTITEPLPVMSCAKALELVTFLLGGYATETADGGIKICKYQIPTSKLAVNGDRMLNDPELGDSSFTMTGVKVIVTPDSVDDEGEPIPEVSYESGIVSQTYENKYMTADMFSVFAANVIGYTYMPSGVGLSLGDPRLEPWDCLAVTDRSGNTYNVPCLQVVHSFDGGLSTEISSGGGSLSSSAPQGSVSKKIDQLNVDMVAARKVVADSIEATNARFTNVEADTAKVHNLTADQLSATVGYIGDLTTANVTAQNIAADHATVGSLNTNYAHITNGVIDNAKIGYADVNGLSANYASIGDLNAATGRISNLEANEAVINDTLTATNAHVEYLESDWISTDRLVLTGNNKNNYPPVEITEAEFNVNKTAYWTKSGDVYTQCTASSVYNPDTQYYVRQTVKSIIEAINTANNTDPQVVISNDKLIAASMDVAELSAITADMGELTTGKIKKGNNFINLDTSPASMEFKNASTWANATQGLQFDTQGNLNIKGKVTVTSGSNVPTTTEMSSAIGTATTDMATNTGVANTYAAKTAANGREQIIYKSAAAGTTSMSGTTTWVTSTSNSQNAWTTKRPSYSQSYPVLFVATQRQTVSQSSGTTCSCTTPIIDDTTTIIDGGNIITGTVTANKLNASDINASNSLTIGALSTSTQDDILNSNIDVGGRNILRGTASVVIGSGMSDGSWANAKFYKSGTGTLESLSYSNPLSLQNVIKATATTANTNIGFAQSAVPIAIGTVTLSAWVKGTAGDTVRIEPCYSDTSGEEETSGVSKDFTIADSNWHKYSHTYTLQHDHLSNGIRAGYVYVRSATANREFYICGQMLEYGNKATDWSPAPEDVDANIGDAKKTATTYITDIDSRKGITLKPSDSSGNDYLQINSDNVTFFRDGEVRTKIQDGWVGFGDLNGSRVTIGTPPTYDSPYVFIANPDNTQAFRADVNGVAVGASNSGHARIKSDGLHVWVGAESTDTNEVAFYGETARIGAENSSRLEITGNSIAGVMSNGNEYFQFSEAGGTTTSWKYIRIDDAGAGYVSNTEVAYNLSSLSKVASIWNDIPSGTAFRIRVEYFGKETAGAGLPTSKYATNTEGFIKGTAKSTTYTQYTPANTVKSKAAYPTMPTHWRTFDGKRIYFGYSTTVNLPFYRMGVDTAESGGSASVVMGTGTKALYENQLSIGQYNENSNAVLQVGWGSSDSDRKNVAYIARDGSIWSNDTIWSESSVLAESGFISHGHSSVIGTVKESWASSAVSVPTATATAVCSVPLEAGTWVITAGTRAPNNATGYRQMNVSATSGDTSIMLTSPAVSGQVTQMVLSRIMTLNSTTTIYVNAYHNAGTTLSYPASGTGYGNYIRAVRIQ